MRRNIWLLVALTLQFLAMPVYAQSNPPAQSDALRTVVITSDSQPGSVIAVAPVTKITVNLRAERRGPTIDMKRWLQKVSSLNGLRSVGIQPWRIVIAYDEFDRDGNAAHHGTYEEYWADSKKFKRAYMSDNFNQTDYANGEGLFRDGEQRWPNPIEIQVAAEILDPFSYAATLQDFHAREVERDFNGYGLQCVFIEKEGMTLSDPTQYCFEPSRDILRYTRGFGAFQTAYNGIISFQGRQIAQDVVVTNGAKPYLRLHVQNIETIQNVDDSIFVPPDGAVNLLGKRVSGVNLMPVKTSYPQYPTSLTGQHFTVEVELVIGKDGHVLNAHALSGPRDAQKACEDAVRKWVYSPFLLLDEPAEVETTARCTMG